EDFLLTADSLLSFQIKKEYRINLKIILKDKDAPFKDTVIKFYRGTLVRRKIGEQKSYCLVRILMRGDTRSC
ncbi:MAG: hypothetical protein D3907_03025, partial [Candidatus Electrothrix sp. AUS3]|nr:hypothetical protein [Candidatus Electrothrix gigas]